MQKIVILFLLFGFCSCIIIEEETYVSYIIINNTNSSIEPINESFDFKPNDYQMSKSGIIAPKDSLEIYYLTDGISKAVDKTPFYGIIDSIMIVYNSNDTIIHYSDNRNLIENNILEEKNWSGGLVNKGRHHQSFAFRYVFEE